MKKSKSFSSSNLKHANSVFKKIYPGDSPGRQPVHTVYGGAQLFKRSSIRKISELGLRSFEEYAPDVNSFAAAFDVDQKSEVTKKVFGKVRSKLESDAVEDFRVDFEDGFGIRPDKEEDETAEFTALETAAAMDEGLLSPFFGIRVKPFTDEAYRRSALTLEIFVTTLLKKINRRLPDNFVVTIPKVTNAAQIISMVKIFESLEKRFKLKKGTLKLEIMVETTQSIFDPKGRANLLPLVDSAKGRCKAAHFGVYDYTASCDITAKFQKMRHPACDFARNMMKVCLAGTGVWLSDGATNVMPIGPHKGSDLSEIEKKENTEAVHRAWKLSYDDIMHSLHNAFYQGWDLHPAQLPVRYAAVYTFFLEGLSQASVRLKNFIDKAAQATLIGDVFDDAATGQGLLNYFLRAINCGAITEDEVLQTGLSIDEIRTKSFMKIIENRKKK